MILTEGVICDIVTLIALPSIASPVELVGMRTTSFTRHRFPPDIICHAVWLYSRFTLSYRDVEDLLAQRGLDISYETVRRWFIKFGNPISNNLRCLQPTPSDYWHFDEMVIVIQGRRQWLNNRAENSHQPFRRREGAMARFRDIKTLQKFAAIHASLHNHVNLEHHVNRRDTVKKGRAAVLAEWQQLAA